MPAGADPSGFYVVSTSRLWVLLRASITASEQVVMHAATESRDDLDLLRELIERGAITSGIDDTYGLAEVPEAFRDQRAGHSVVARPCRTWPEARASSS